MKSLPGRERGFTQIELLAVIKKHLCVAIVSVLALSVSVTARAQNLFVADQGSINEYTPAGVPGTFASGLNSALGLTFNSAGNLFVAENHGGGNIYEYTPNGTRSTFASGLYYPLGLAFNSSGNLFANVGDGYIYEFTPNGMRSTFASCVNTPTGLAFNTAGNLFAADQRDGLI